MAWDYPMFFMFTNSIGYCCRTPKLTIDDELLDSMGDDFWSNHPQFVKRREELVNGIKVRPGIIDTNEKILNQAEKNFIGIKQYLSNPTQFAR